MYETSVLLAHGTMWPLLDPKPEHVNWLEFAEAMGRIARFNGHQGKAGLETYCLAQHSLLVGNLMPDEYRLYGLIHDCHEVPTGDKISPLKRAEAVLGGGKEFLAIQGRADHAIYTAAGLPPMTDEIAEAVMLADLTALATEFRDVTACPPLEVRQRLPEPHPERLHILPGHVAARLWHRAVTEEMARCRAA